MHVVCQENNYSSINIQYLQLNKAYCVGCFSIVCNGFEIPSRFLNSNLHPYKIYINLEQKKKRFCNSNKGKCMVIITYLNVFIPRNIIK